MLWNLHTIRKTTNDQLAHGRPFTMYTTPDNYDTHDYLCQVNELHIEACKEQCTFKDIVCDKDLKALCELLMEEKGWQKAKDAVSGRYLYKALRENVYSLLYQ